MIKRNIFALTLLLLVTQISMSQVKREILEEDPKQASNLRLDLSPLQITTNFSQNLQLGAAFSGKLYYRWNNKFSVSGDFYKDYSNTSGLDGEYVADDYKGSGYEANLNFYFLTKEKEGNDWMPIKSKSVGHNTVEVTVDPLATSVLKLYGVRAGYGRMQRGVTLNHVSIHNSDNPADNKSDVIADPLQTLNYAFGGINISTIKNVKVEYPVYGIRRKQAIVDYYFDVLYSTSSSLSLVKGYSSLTGDSEYYSVNPEAISLKNVGFRLGMFAANTGRLINASYGWDIGFAPGAQSTKESFFVTLKYCVSLSKKVGVAEE